MKRGEILDSVKKTITQDRNNWHGEPENSFPRIAEEWTRYLMRRPEPLGGISPSDVAELMAIFKTVRFENQPDNPDNEHDRIGYYAIAAELRATERKALKIMKNSEYGKPFTDETEKAEPLGFSAELEPLGFVPEGKRIIGWAEAMPRPSEIGQRCFKQMHNGKTYLYEAIKCGIHTSCKDLVWNRIG